MGIEESKVIFDNNFLIQIMRNLIIISSLLIAGTIISSCDPNEGISEKPTVKFTLSDYVGDELDATNIANGRNVEIDGVRLAFMDASNGRINSFPDIPHQSHLEFYNTRIRYRELDNNSTIYSYNLFGAGAIEDFSVTQGYGQYGDAHVRFFNLDESTLQLSQYLDKIGQYSAATTFIPYDADTALLDADFTVPDGTFTVDEDNNTIPLITIKLADCWVLDDPDSLIDYVTQAAGEMYPTPRSKMNVFENLLYVYTSTFLGRDGVLNIHLKDGTVKTVDLPRSLRTPSKNLEETAVVGSNGFPYFRPFIVEVKVNKLK